MGRPPSRLEDRVERLIFKKELEPYLEKIRQCFVPFKKDVHNLEKFEKWYSLLQTLEISQGMRAGKTKIKVPQNIKLFLEAFSELNVFIHSYFKFFNSNIATVITEKTLFGEISSRHRTLGVSFEGKTVEDDDSPYDYVNVRIEPGASKKEVLEFMGGNWKSINNYLKHSLIESNPLLKKVRPKKDQVKKLEIDIIDLYKKNPHFTDIQIAGHFPLNGNISFVRKTISRWKNNKI